MSCHRPFCRNTSLAAAAVAALVLLAPAQVVPARAQAAHAAQQATLSDITNTTKSDSAKPPASQKTGAGNVAAVDQANPAQQKSLTSKAIEKVKQVAKSAGDIFNRVPCLPPKGGAKSVGSLPHVASKLAAGEPVVIVAAATNRGMGIVADAKSDIKTIKDLKGKRVAIFPGSTQEVVILERLKAEGMSISDIQPIRLSFSDMAAALARGDIDAYVGAEPGPGISLANGTGRLIEYPYSTPIGSLNMILSASEKMIKQDPDRIKMIVKMHEQATDYAMAHPEEMIQVAMQKLGQQRKSIEIAVPNVELTWKIDDEFIRRAKAYSELMVEKKQVRQAPDMAHAITEQFM